MKSERVQNLCNDAGFHNGRSPINQDEMVEILLPTMKSIDK